MKLLLTATSLLPAYGGPAYSITRLAEALTGAGAQVGLWAPDQSAAATPLLSGDTSVLRLTGSEREVLASFGDPDVLHDNGIWLPHNHRLAVLATERRIPRVVSTRGMLLPWAMRYKRWKKRFAWWLYQRRDLQRARLLHATSQEEANNLKALDLGIPVSLVRNGVDLPEIAHDWRGVHGEKSGGGGMKTALFLGRIDPVKGLPMLIEAWRQVRPKGWLLEIAGPDEVGHRALLERAVAVSGLAQSVSFLGPLTGQAKTTAFANASLFVLPSLSESFGMAIAEALSYGLPALTTNAAPWAMLAERGCGWTVDATVEGITNGLRQATSLDGATLQAMGAKGRELIAAEFGVERVAAEFVTIYHDIVTSVPGQFTPPSKYR